MMESKLNFCSTANADYLVRRLPQIQKTIGNFFDVHKLFSNDRIFSNLGKILCGKPFPRSDNIRFVNNIIYSQDYNGADKDEVDAMPSNAKTFSLFSVQIFYCEFSQRLTASSFIST